MKDTIKQMEYLRRALWPEFWKGAHRSVTQSSTGNHSTSSFIFGSTTFSGLFLGFSHGVGCEVGQLSAVTRLFPILHERLGDLDLKVMMVATVSFKAFATKPNSPQLLAHSLLQVHPSSFFFFSLPSTYFSPQVSRQIHPGVILSNAQVCSNLFL